MSNIDKYRNNKMIVQQGDSPFKEARSATKNQISVKIDRKKHTDIKILATKHGVPVYEMLDRIIDKGIVDIEDEDSDDVK